MHRVIPLRTFICAFAALLFLLGVSVADAATLSLSPGTGVYNTGGTFTANVVINTEGAPVNAAEGQLTFNPLELNVVSVSRGASIFNLWTQEPTFSNAVGTISFGGGSPSGYTGAQGTVVSVVFKVVAAGNPRVQFAKGSVLAADGRGTNVLSSMNGGNYTVVAKAVEPAPEYIAPPNTPRPPQVTSLTHPEQSGWYRDTTAELNWTLPSDITAIRTLLDDTPGTIPTIVYDEPIRSKTIEDVPNGVSYFHIQFKNSEGWGRVSHYRLGVDTEPPSVFEISKGQVGEEDTRPALIFTVEDISPVTRYLIQFDGNEPIEFIDEEETGVYPLLIEPGHHTVIVEAFDSAGNSLITTFSFDIEAFEQPIFTEYPSRIATDVIPLFMGATRPNANLVVTITNRFGEVQEYQVESNEEGAFIVIPDGTFGLGVYDVVAVATDKDGRMSEPSTPIRFVVENPGYIQIGSIALSVLSVMVPLIALLLVLIFGVWYLWHRLQLWRKRIIKETKEAEYRLAVEFGAITSHMTNNIKKLKRSKRGKLTKAEEKLVDELREDVETARKRINKEIGDIDDVVK